MESPDHFITRDGHTFAGNHLILDMWGAEGLCDLKRLETAIRAAVKRAGATLLHIHLHHFGEGCGVSGVAVLAESHISVHTWPERGFAAFDIFMCGEANPNTAMSSLIVDLLPTSTRIEKFKRGLVK